MQTQNSYRNQGSQSREAPVQNVSWNRGTQEMPGDEIGIGKLKFIYR
ncbi:hypothetical protein [Roseburia intestinalis]|nr:hypothetical protein [Roseburia intestinalis]UWP55613.1 hypothetical protein NQ522_20450 [Roseburia intestinalis]